MADSTIVLNVIFEAKPGRADDLAAMLTSMVEPTRTEPGCITYQLSSSTETPGNFLFFEKFANQDAFDEHMASEYVKAFAKQREQNDPVAKVTVTRWSVLA